MHFSCFFLEPDVVAAMCRFSVNRSRQRVATSPPLLRMSWSRSQADFQAAGPPAGSLPDWPYSHANHKLKLFWQVGSKTVFYQSDSFRAICLEFVFRWRNRRRIGSVKCLGANYSLRSRLPMHDAPCCPSIFTPEHRAMLFADSVDAGLSGR